MDLGDDIEVFDELDLANAIVQKNGLPSETDFPSDQEHFIPAKLSAVPDRKFVLDVVERVEDPLTSSEVKALIDADQPFQMTIATDARQIREDWVRIDPTAGSIPHVFNVVGYGRGNDPADNKEKDYLVLRDSFTDGKLHYRASVEGLLPFMISAQRVKSVKTLDRPTAYSPVKLE